MEQRLKSFLQDQSVRWTLLASLITAAAAYSYGMLNNIVNYDTIFNIPNVTGGGEASGLIAPRRVLFGVITVHPSSGSVIPLPPAARTGSRRPGG